MEGKSAVQMIEQISTATGKSSAELKKLIKEKKGKFSGLLTDSGAAFMVAKELGVDLGIGEGKKQGEIAKLKDGMQNVDLLVRVMQVFSPKEFERNGKKGRLCNLVVADPSGETRLTLWHQDVQKMLDAGVERGSVLRLHNCYVKSFNGKPQLNLSFNGAIAVNPQGADEGKLPKVEAKLVKLSKLRPDMNDVGAVVRVLRLFPVNEFEREGRKGRVMNFLVGDESATIRATAWNDLVGEAKKLRENDLVKVEGAYTKEGMKGVELHLGWRARIIPKQEGEGGVPSAMQLMHADVAAMKIKQLQSGGNAVALEAGIVAVNTGQLRYSVCPKCGGKVQRMEQGAVCDKCGEVKEPGIRPVLSVRLDDGSAQINAVAYGVQAEQLMGFGKEELKKRLKEGSVDSIVQQLGQALVGKRVKAVGIAKENSFSNEMEFVLRGIEL